VIARASRDAEEAAADASALAALAWALPLDAVPVRVMRARALDALSASFVCRACADRIAAAPLVTRAAMLPTLLTDV
jgi:hypothetical protein